MVLGPRPADEVLAHHEAGHAVVARRLGLDVDSVSIVGNERSHGRTELYEWSLEDGQGRLDVEWHAASKVMQWLAGRESVARVFGEQRAGEGTEGDEAGARRLALDLAHQDPAEAHLYIEWLRYRVRRLARESHTLQAQISVVASALIVERQLDYGRFREVVAEVPDDPDDGKMPL